jgi:hypothetical protein
VEPSSYFERLAAVARLGRDEAQRGQPFEQHRSVLQHVIDHENLPALARGP